MKIIYVDCGLSNEYFSNLPSNKHYLSRNENKTWKKIQACTAFELMTFKPVQCSSNWANKPINWELIIIMLVCDKPVKWWINENQICELWIKKWIWKWHFLSEKHYTKACSINSENKALTTAA